MSIMQPINAQIQAQFITEILKGGVPDTSRPQHLAVSGLDEILETAAQEYVPIGQEISRWIGKNEFSEFAESYARNDHCFGFGNEKGLTVETPFASDTALICLAAETKHPQLGSGLLATLQIPLFSDAAEIADECAFWNFFEATSWTGFPLLGCWHPNASRGMEVPAFTTFVPNALYQPGLATNLALWMLDRARWVRQTRWPDLEDKPIVDILEDRRRLSTVADQPPS
jgi:hypothetical protein